MCLLGWFYRWAARRRRARLVYVPASLEMTVADDPERTPTTA